MSPSECMLALRHDNRMSDCPWSLLLVSLGTRIVIAKMYVLSWLRDDTLCYALSECLHLTFLEQKDSLVVFSGS